MLILVEIDRERDMKVYLFVDEFDDSQEGITIADSIEIASKQQEPYASEYLEGLNILRTEIEKVKPWDYYRVTMYAKYPDDEDDFLVTYLVSEYDFEMGKVTWYVK